MKIQTKYMLRAEIKEAIENKAKELGVPASYVVELLTRYLKDI
jgi:hypothetical protein